MPNYNNYNKLIVLLVYRKRKKFSAKTIRG